MKQITLTAIALAVMTLSSHAQTTATGTASSNVGVTAQSQSLAQGGSGGSITFQGQPSRTRSTNTTTYDGDYTVRNVPQVTAPSMGSGHPCGLGTSIGLSIVGGGGTGGNTRSDDACLLAQMGHTDAATIMIAGRNKAACRALVAAGKISSSSYCGSGTRSATASNNAPAAVAPAASPNAATVRLSTSNQRTIPAGSVTCEHNNAGQLVKVNKRRDVATDVAMAYCRQQ